MKKRKREKEKPTWNHLNCKLLRQNECRNGNSVQQSEIAIKMNNLHKKKILFFYSHCVYVEGHQFYEYVWIALAFSRLIIPFTFMNRTVGAAAAIDMKFIRSIMVRWEFNTHAHANTHINDDILCFVMFIISDDVLWFRLCCHYHFSFFIHFFVLARIISIWSVLWNFISVLVVLAASPNLSDCRQNWSKKKISMKMTSNPINIYKTFVSIDK